jgi:nucleotide-binding universal stress UspA family protein
VCFRSVVKVYKKILIPLDGSNLSEYAVKHLNSVTMTAGGTSLILLRVVEPITNLYAGGYYAFELAAKAKKEAKTDAHKYLEKIANKLRQKGIDIETVVTDGVPADDILDYVAKHKVDLIIMSTHGRSGISRWFAGSVAEKVIRHSTVPVLITPPPSTRASR